MLDRTKIVQTLLILLAFSAFGGLFFFFIVGERYTTSRLPQTGPLVLMDPPAWTSEELINDIYATAGAREFPLTANSLKRVAARLEETCWLDHVKVQLTGESLIARADWHQPIAMVKSGTTRFYVDAVGVALEHVPLTNLPLVTVTNLGIPRPPAFGRVVDRDDLKAAVALISLLRLMDEQSVPVKPLLREIESVDMKNFRGRRDKDASHIVLYTLDKTPILWGAEIGNWAQFMEASDEEKLGRLYTYYQERGTLQGGVKRINLREPREIPRPAAQVQAPTR